MSDLRIAVYNTMTTNRYHLLFALVYCECNLFQDMRGIDIQTL